MDIIVGLMSTNHFLAGSLLNHCQLVGEQILAQVAGFAEANESSSISMSPLISLQSTTGSRKAYQLAPVEQSPLQADLGNPKPKKALGRHSTGNCTPFAWTPQLLRETKGQRHYRSG